MENCIEIDKSGYCDPYATIRGEPAFDPWAAYPAHISAGWCWCDPLPYSFVDWDSHGVDCREVHVNWEHRRFN